MKSCCNKPFRILVKDSATFSSAFISKSMELNSLTISSCLAVSGTVIIQSDRSDLLISRNVLPDAYFSHQGLMMICK